MKRFLPRWPWLLPGLFLAGCAPATITAAPTAVVTPGVYQVGQLVPVPGWSITVTDSFLTGAPSGVSDLVVDLTLVHTSARATRPPTFILSVAGEQEAATTFPGQLPLPPMIASSVAVQGQLAWSVPITATRFTLAYQSLAVWLLSLTT